MAEYKYVEKDLLDAIKDFDFRKPGGVGDTFAEFIRNGSDAGRREFVNKKIAELEAVTPAMFVTSQTEIVKGFVGKDTKCAFSSKQEGIRFDDPQIYADMLKNMTNIKPDKFLNYATFIETVIIDYLGKKQIDKNKYVDFTQYKDLSIKDFHKYKNNAFDYEFAILFHNMNKILGIPSVLIMDSNYAVVLCAGDGPKTKQGVPTVIYPGASVESKMIVNNRDTGEEYETTFYIPAFRRFEGENIKTLQDWLYAKDKPRLVLNDKMVRENLMDQNLTKIPQFEIKIKGPALDKFDNIKIKCPVSKEKGIEDNLYM